jgi:hypothetical protein
LHLAHHTELIRAQVAFQLKHVIAHSSRLPNCRCARASS